MSLRKELKLIFCLKLLVASIATVESLRAISKQYDFAHRVLIQDTRSLHSPGQVFGFCNDTLQNTAFVRCTFYYEDHYEDVNSPEHVTSCNFLTRGYLDPNGFLSVKRQIIALKYKRAVLITEQRRIEFLVIDFYRCIVARVKRIPVTFAFAEISATSDNAFDILVSDMEGPCQRRKPCRIEVTNHADGVEAYYQPKAWVERNLGFVAVTRSLSVWWRMVVDRYVENSEEKVRVYTVNDTRVIKVLKEYPVEPKNTDVMVDIKPYDRVIASTTHYLTSVCSIIDLTLSCSQFQLNGTLNFETTLKIVKHSRLFSIKIHNLQEGGFLLITTECSRKFTDECYEDDHSFFVTKIDKNGRRVGSIELVQFLCYDGDVHDRVHYFKDRNTGESCLSIACKKSPEPSTKISFDIVCFEGHEFDSYLNVIENDQHNSVSL